MALELLSQMREKKIKPNVFTYNAAIAALAKSSRRNMKSKSGEDEEQLWCRALQLFEDMREAGLEPDAFTYTSVIDACGNGGRWQEALDLIEIMQQSGPKLRPSKVSFTAAITACAKSGKSEQAVKLFSDMQSAGIMPDRVSYNALMSSLLTGEKPELAFDVWNEMCGKANAPKDKKIASAKADIQSVSPDIITLTNAIGALDRSPESIGKVDKIFADAVLRNLVLKKDSLDTLWEVDLSGMSFAVARAAIRFVIRSASDAVINDGEEIEDLNLITGVKGAYQDLVAKRKLNDDQDTDIQLDGATAQAQIQLSRGGLREYVQECLRTDFDPPIYTTSPKLALGTVVIGKENIRRWMDAQRENNDIVK